MDNINVLLSICFTLSLIILIINLIEYEENKFNLPIISTIISGLLLVLIPTKKDAAIIYVTPKLVNSKFVQDDCPEIAKLGIEALKQQLLEFTKGVKDESKSK